MSIKPLLLPEDPRWMPFCERYAGDAGRFAIEVQGIMPSHQQHNLFASVSKSRLWHLVTAASHLGRWSCALMVNACLSRACA